MSISAVSSSQLGGILSSLVSNVKSASIVSTTANGGSGFVTGGSTGLTSEFTGLLKSLATGNQAGASTALQQLVQSLKTVPLGASATGPTGTFSAFSQALSDSLSSGDLSGALASLTSFLVSTGHASGNVVNTSA